MRALRNLGRRFATDNSAVAAVEFALVLPVMLLLYLGTMEASALISMDRRVQTVAGTIGDLVAREDKTIPAARLKDYFRAAENIIAPFPTDKLVQTVSFISIDADGETLIEWSRRFTGAGAGEERDHTAGHTAGESYDLPEEITSLAENGYVVVSEASYSYTPLLGLVFESDFPLYRENFYLPRFGEKICYDAAPPC
ncbi:TadE/TadG family type IV pilus assembly protein [Devosia nitrariae]|uniref:Pilus biosynthesis protein TadE n=1 Tax=Devosia nitrariae TaxID=2071872 RepID=A0ABQ5W0K2_9HYPH|nr:TadE/TadG family type IV pilus assembly protein [Devosia nitrariae]GLQ53266.1 pilus biosynthesis protein TadE [Devosia nitrariae]